LLEQRFKQKRKEITNNIKQEQKSDKADVEELEKQIAAFTDEADAQRGTIETQLRQESQQKNAGLEMNIENEQEQQEILKREKEEAALRGEE
jgi:hypothetical protein